MAGRNPAEGVRGGRGRAWGEGLSRRIPRLHLYCINSIDGARSLNWRLVISRTITLRLDEDVYQRFHIVGRARQPPTPTSSKTRSCATWSDPVAAILCARAGGVLLLRWSASFRPGSVPGFPQAKKQVGRTFVIDDLRSASGQTRWWRRRRDQAFQAGPGRRRRCGWPQPFQHGLYDRQHHDPDVGAAIIASDLRVV